jgi:CHAT domain-containing protein
VLTEGLGVAARRENAEWPRITWCPVGVMSRLPLHASGHHNDARDRPGGPRTVLDQAVSAYTTSARALADARPPRIGTGHTPLVIAVTDGPPPFEPLDASKEAERIRKLIPQAVVWTDPAPSAVRVALVEHSIAHFACHGSTNPQDPEQSYLALPDDHTAPLTVASIISILVDADLAYLSACDTTVTPASLDDEFIHLTSAFQLAGYRHVIGTLWRVHEPTSADMAVEFYRHLTLDGTLPPDPGLSARALHEAVRALREEYPNSPSLWAAYTHTGMFAL